MAIKWEPPSEEELVARGIGAALDTERTPLDDSKSEDAEARAAKPRRKKGD